MAFDGAVDFGVVLIFSRDFMWHRDLFNWCIKVGPGVFGYDQLMQGPLEACSQSTRLPGARHSLHAICATWELFPSAQLYCLGSELGGCEEVAHGLLHLVPPAPLAGRLGGEGVLGIPFTLPPSSRHRLITPVTILAQVLARPHHRNHRFMVAERG